jgi:UDPglucose--hexose-1-phosphate uridylyltransferase
VSEFRYNKLTRQWVLFAPNRARRPHSNTYNQTQTTNQPCPFDQGNESLTPQELLRVPHKKQNWNCRVVPNLYNALCIEQENKAYKFLNFELKSGFGAHEVIIETPEHNKTMTSFNTHELFEYFYTIQLRLKDLKKDTRLKYFSVFKNYGIDAGASQEHAHSQIIATPFLPKSIQEDLDFFQHHKEETNRDFFDDFLYDEKLFEQGILKENNYFVAFCPYASQHPFEVMVLAKDPLSSIITFEEYHLYALAEIVHYLFGKLSHSLGDFAFNMILKNGAIQEKHNPNRFHLQILPRLFKTAGFEIDSDIFINTFPPEDVAQILKNKKDQK